MKTILVLIALTVLTPSLAPKAGSTAWAAMPQRAADEGKGCSVPKEWGRLQGVADRSMAFEDASGNIRVLDLGPCMRGQTQLIVKINRP